MANHTQDVAAFGYWLGTPDRVLASTRLEPRTKFPHPDGIYLDILEYDCGPRASATRHSVTTVREFLA